MHADVLYRWDFSRITSADSELIALSCTNDCGSTAVTVSVIAWWFDDQNAESAKIGLVNNKGIGVCNEDEPGYKGGCNAPDRCTVNSDGVELIVFTLSAPVTLSSLVVTNEAAPRPRQSGLNLTYWLNVSIGENTSLGSLGTGHAFENACPEGTCTVTNTLSGTNVRSLAVAASPGRTRDAFLSQALAANGPGQVTSSGAP